MSVWLIQPAFIGLAAHEFLVEAHVVRGVLILVEDVAFALHARVALGFEFGVELIAHGGARVDRRGGSSRNRDRFEIVELLVAGRRPKQSCQKGSFGILAMRVEDEALRRTASQSM
jgi:hypothetical protein